MTRVSQKLTLSQKHHVHEDETSEISFSGGGGGGGGCIFSLLTRDFEFVINTE